MMSPYVSTLAAAFLSFLGTEGCIFQETEGGSVLGGGCATGMFSIKTTRFSCDVYTVIDRMYPTNYTNQFEDVRSVSKATNCVTVSVGVITHAKL